MKHLKSKGFFSVAILSAIIFAGLVVCTQPARAAADIDHDKIRLQSLNKSTAETSTFEVEVGDTIKLGPLYIRPQACRTTPVSEEPETAGFIQIWTVRDAVEEGEKPKSEWVFSGWMFASSPGLSSMDHAVYDLWVLDCGKEAGASNVVSAVAEEKESDELENPDEDIIIEEDDSGDAPIVKLGGQELYVPEVEPEQTLEEAPLSAPVPEDNVLVLPDEQAGEEAVLEEGAVESDGPTPPQGMEEEDDAARFEAYEEESAPTVRLE